MLIASTNLRAKGSAPLSCCLPALPLPGVYVSSLADAPKDTKAHVPVVVFLHGFSRLSLKPIGEWQLWLASLGVANMVPDSFTQPCRLTCTSPVGTTICEKIHALPASEIPLALKALGSATLADSGPLERQ